MDENGTKKGYWIYSIVTVVVFCVLFAFWGYLVYDLIIKLSMKDFSNNTVVQALITLIITVFIGGYFSKSIESKFSKKNQLYKTRIDISLKLIDLASAYYRETTDEIKNMLIFESAKVKLFFDDDTLKKLNIFIESDKNSMITNYNLLINELKKNIK